MASRRELDQAVLARASLITVDSLGQAKEEAGDPIHGRAGVPRGRDAIIELSEVVAGKRQGRTDSGTITIFKSTGIAIWDVAAGFIYREAFTKGKGKRVEIRGEQ